MSDTAMVPALVCERWRLMLPEYRALRHVELPFWEKPRLDSMHANLRAGDVVYDVGTEDGDLSALFATWVGGHAGWDEITVQDGAHRIVETRREPIGRPGGVVLIEPNPKVWPSIRAIWEANSLAPPLYTWAGFADRSGVGSTGAGSHTWPTTDARERMNPAHGFLELKDKDAAVRQGEHPASISIDRLSSHHVKRPPTAITIDVEGAEYRVLLGADRTLREDRPLVWVSIHPEMMGAYRSSPGQLVAFMATRGYRREHLAAEHEWHTFFYPEERTVRLPYGGTR